MFFLLGLYCFICFFLDGSLESGDFSFVTSFNGFFESLFGFNLFLLFFDGWLGAFGELLFLGLGLLSLNLQESFSMFSNFDLLLLFGLEFFVSIGMFINFLLSIFILLNLFISSDVFRNFFVLVLLLLDFEEDLSVFSNFNFFLNYLFLLG